MCPNFTIDVDPARDFIHIQMRGLFASDDVEAFLQERDRAHALLRCAPNQHVTLTDLSELKIQPQEIVAAFGKVLQSADRHRSRRLAFVAPPTLTRSQLLRALKDRDARCFDTAEAAKVWLFAEEQRTAAA